MDKYLLIFRGGDPEESGLSPEELQQSMQRWREWVASMTEQGIYLAGEALEPGGRVVSSPSLVSDGPFTESKELVGGFMLLQVKDEAEAIAQAKNCPIFDVHGQVEVRAIREIE